MPRMISALLYPGGVIGCSAAAIQISQLAGGHAAPDLLNYAITAITLAAGIGLTGAAIRTSCRLSGNPPDERALTAALDRLFAHFPDDDAGKEAVRVVARAVTERRYRLPRQSD